MESVKNNKMDEKIKAKFDNFAPPVPTDLWNKIEIELDFEQPIKMMPVKGKRSSFFIYSGAVAATLLVAFTFWKFGEDKTTEPKQSPEVYASNTISEENEPSRVGIKEEQQAKQGSVLKSSPIVAVKKPIEEVGGLTPKSQTVEVESATKAKAEESQREVDYHALYAEAAFSASSIDKVIGTQEVLPLEGEIIALKVPVLLQEEIQDSLLEEVSSSKNKKIGVSTVLNFLAKGLSNESGKSIEFSESEEGILKLDLKLGFAKSND